MSALTLVLSIALPIVSLAIAVWVGFRFMKKTGSGKIAFRKHFLTLAVALVLCLSLTMAVSAAGGDAGAAGDAGTASESADAADSGAGIATGLGFIGAALSIDLAAVGAGIALSAGAPAAIGAVAEDPKSFGKSMIFVALGEAIAIYGFIIAFMIILKIPNLPTL